MPEQAACVGGAATRQEPTEQARSGAARQPAGQPAAGPAPNSLLRPQHKRARPLQGAAAAAKEATHWDAHVDGPAHSGRGEAAGSGGDSAGGGRAQQHARRERQRAFARLEPSVPGSARHAGAYTGAYAFPDSSDGGAAEDAASSQGQGSAHAPDRAGVRAGLAVTVVETGYR